MLQRLITSYSATLIDNIFTNNISASCDNGLIINDLSDHLPIFTLCYTDAHSSTIKPKESVAIRNFSSQNINAFNNLLCEFDWNSLIYADANAAYNGFLQKYTEFYNKSFPIKFCQGKNLKLYIIRVLKLESWNKLKQSLGCINYS